jgi:hypothetical protein
MRRATKSASRMQNADAFSARVPVKNAYGLFDHVLRRQTPVAAEDPLPTPVYYANFDAAVAGSYSLTTGRISQLSDLSGNGRHLTQSVAADRPVIAAFSDARDSVQITSGIEWLLNTGTPLGALPSLTTAAFAVDLSFILDTGGAVGTIASWSTAGNANPNMMIGVASTNRIRVQRRDNSSTVKTLDLVAATLTPGTKYNLSASFYGGLMSMWLNGVLVAEDTDYVTGTSTLALNTFSIGARVLNTTTQPFLGRIQSVRVRQN